MLTITVVHDQEKPTYTRLCLESIFRWNDPAGVRVVVLDQSAGHTAAHEPIFGEEVVAFRRGAPRGVWDVMADLRSAGLPATWWLHLHNEHVLEPGCLGATEGWLAWNHSPLALANLRRLGPRPSSGQVQHTPGSREITERLLAIADGPEAVREFLGRQPSCPWDGAEDNAGRWREDAFFADLAWLGKLKFFDVANRMIGQDVYDLVGKTTSLLAQAGAPLGPIPRCPESRLYHLWHAKPYNWVTDETIAWFASDPARWNGTLFTGPRLRALRAFLDDPAGKPNDKYKFRCDEGGTRQRFMAAMMTRIEDLKAKGELP